MSRLFYRIAEPKLTIEMFVPEVVIPGINPTRRKEDSRKSVGVKGRPKSGEIVNTLSPTFVRCEVEASRVIQT